MMKDRLTLIEAKNLLETNGYELCSQVNLSYGFYHPGNPRQSILVISAEEILSREMTKRVYDAINRLSIGD